MAPNQDVNALILNPTKIEMSIRSWQHERRKIIRSETDLHAIYPYPVEFFVEELLDFENTKNTYPRVEESILEYSSEDPFGKHSLWVHINVQVLGFGAEYTYVTDNWTERYDGGYLQKYHLNRSPDGTLYQLIGSWYVEELTIGGKPHTYMRNYAVIGIQKGTLSMELAMKAFGMWQLKQLFRNIHAAVRARYEAQLSSK